MRFKNQQRDSSLPEINLVPMMDVLMTVLTFFILTSMTLTGQRLANVNLPSVSGAEAGEGTGKPVESLVIGLNQQGQILLDNQAIDFGQLSEKITTYLTQNPQGTLVLKADRELPYEEVEKLLKEMNRIGGDRVSLAIERR